MALPLSFQPQALPVKLHIDRNHSFLDSDIDKLFTALSSTLPVLQMWIRSCLGHTFAIYTNSLVEKEAKKDTLTGNSSIKDRDEENMSKSTGNKTGSHNTTEIITPEASNHSPISKANLMCDRINKKNRIQSHR